MRPKINQKMIIGTVTQEETTTDNFITRSLAQVLHYLIEEGAPLNPDSIRKQGSTGIYNSGKENEYTVYTLIVSADFIDSKQITHIEGDSSVEESAKKFGFKYEGYSYLNNPNNNFMRFHYVCSENNFVDIDVDGGQKYQYPLQRSIQECHSSYWTLMEPAIEWKVNTIKDGETFYFGIEMIHEFSEKPSDPIINAAFTPAKSLSDPTKKLDYCFFNIQNNEYAYEKGFFTYGGYIGYSFPELGLQKVPIYHHGFQVSPVGNFIEANETNKVVLLPVMIGIEDYYLDKIYLSNITRKNHAEEAVELDKGIFLISGSRYPMSREEEKYSAVALFDITESMSQEEE